MQNKPNLSKDGTSVEFEDAISSTGYGLFNVAALLVSGGCLMAVIVETTSMSFILPAAQCDLDLTQSEMGILTSISFLGVVMSSLLWGFIGDTMGRRKVIMVTTYISCAMSVASCLCPYVWMFIFFRFWNGFFIGGPSAVVYAYLGEFHSDLHRPRSLTWAAVFIALATIYVPGLAWVILPINLTVNIPGLNIVWRSWRLLILINAVPSFICATCLVFLPESPKYLWVNGKSDEALEVLRKIFSVNKRQPKIMFTVKSLAIPTERANNSELKVSDSKIMMLSKKMWNQTASLFSFPLLSKTFMASLLQFGVFASSSGYLMWLPTILNKVTDYSAKNPNNTVLVCKSIMYIENITDHLEYKYLRSIEQADEDCSDVINEKVFIITIILGTVFAFAYILNGIIINITGKKLLLISYLLITGLCGILIDFVSGYVPIVIMSGLFLTAGTAVSIMNTIVVDIYPTQYRAMAMAITLMMGRLGAVTGSNTMSYLIEEHCSFLFYIFGGQQLVLIGIALLLPIPLFVFKSGKQI